MVNKLPDELENPIDILLYSHIDTQLDFYYKCGFTPNMITTISLIAGLTSVYAVYKDYYIIGAILWAMQHYYDCVDGKLARAYNMVSKFGDLYDHGTDIIKYILLLYVLYLKIKNKPKKTIIIIVLITIILLFLFFIQASCQEIVSNSDVPISKILQKQNINNCPNKMKYTRYFSVGFLTIYLIIIILLVKHI